MDFFATVKRRRSIRRFTDQTIPHEDIISIIEAATLAPSATNEQPWHFIVIRDNETKNTLRDIVNAIMEEEISSTADRSRIQRLSRMKNYSVHFADAPVAIAVLAQPWTGGSGHFSTKETTPRDLGIESVSMAVAHLQLAATALDYGSCFSSAPAEFARAEIEAVLDAKPPWFLIGIVSLGTPSMEPQRPSPRKSLNEICTFIG